MDAITTQEDLLKLAGIDDLPVFYRDRFYTGGVLNAAYFDVLLRFDINMARTMWVYDNVRHGASVLDLGCGEGLLALLKRKKVTLFAVDISMELLAQARRNGYDEVYAAHLTSLPFRNNTFDYVISLDVLGHVPLAEKPRVLAEIKRVLKPDGTTMHGIECLDRDLHGDYDAMSVEKLRRFVAIDGHVGLEDDDEHVSRFRTLFRHVEARSRYTLCLSVAEFIKQADEYGVPFERDFIDYLYGLSFNERRAFDMAMGYVFAKISDLDIRLPKSGLYMLLKASDAHAEPFYNAHRNRQDLFGDIGLTRNTGWISLDRDSRATFDSGWYPPNDLPPVARWMGSRGRVRFTAPTVSRVRLDLTTHIPDLKSKPLTIQVQWNGVLLVEFSLIDYGWLQLEISLPDGAERRQVFDLDIATNRTWRPSAVDETSKDDRELSIAICNLEVYCPLAA